jgi:glycosyltransferase involved in cell wall biosynthesis
MSVVAVVTSSPPFVEGGHLVIARALVEALRVEGHESDLILTPQNRFGRQGAAYLANWLTDVGRTHDGRAVDQVISLRYPSYAVRHPRHVCWLLHTMREYYDQWEAFSKPLSWKGRIKERTRRRLVWTADRYLLGSRVSRLFVISGTVQRRLRTFGNIDSEVLYPPAPPRPYRTDDYEPYLFAVSRFTPLKRMALIVEALARPEAAGIRAVLAGEGEQHAQIARLVHEYGLAERVSLPGRLTDRELLDHLARCRAVVFPPFDEDYGFVTIEAFAAAKPVITCADSGGPVELVTDGKSGFVLAPDAAALAGAMRRVIDDRDAAERMGRAGAEIAARHTWSQTVRRLLLPVD